MRHVPGRLVVALVVAAVLVGGAGVFLVHAQIPSTFKNLQVMPKDISRAQLIAEMREMAGSLGVRCNHCHTGGNPQTLEGMDFASDTLEAKRVARAMMKMTREINATFLPATGRDPAHMAQVKCITCHHGGLEPETLADTLLRAIDQGGAPAATAAYRDLREKFHGRSRYDFGEQSLSWTAEQAARKPANADAAIALLELNMEFFPKSANTLVVLGDRYALKGDTTAAIARWNQALAIEPGNRFIQSKIDQARGVKK
jgi:hypothetical protein